jgi:hypothetical protein
MGCNVMQCSQAGLLAPDPVDSQQSTEKVLFAFLCTYKDIGQTYTVIRRVSPLRRSFGFKTK